MKNLMRSVPGRFVAVAAVAGVAILFTACGVPATAAGPRSTGPEATAVAIEASQALERRLALAERAVRNGSYELPGIGAFALTDGMYQAKYGPGATQVGRAGVVAVAFGDLDGDQVDDAAVVLWTNTGGSGTFFYLAPILDASGTVAQAGALLLGDRVQIKSLAVDGGAIKVDLLSQGPGDAMVSPTLRAEHEYRLRGGALTRVAASTTQPPTAPADPTPTPPRLAATAVPAPSAPAAPTAPPTRTPASIAPTTLATPPTTAPATPPAPTTPAAAPLAGTIYTWQRYVDNGERGGFAVPYPPAYRLELLADGTYRVQADCNQGSGGYRLEASRLTLSPGPMTRAACRAGSREQQFVQLLGQVASFRLEGTTLHLNLAMDAGSMVFTRFNAVTGRIVGPSGATLPAGATAEVMILDPSGRQVGGWLGNAQLPMAFEAPYDPANLDLASTYTLDVTIKDAQKRPIFRGTRAYPVVTRGNPTYHLDVAVERAP